MPWLLEPSNLLLTMVALSCAFGFVLSLRLPKSQARTTRIVLLALLGACAISYALAPSYAGWVALGLWLGFIGVPGWTLRLAMRRARGGHFREAGRLLGALRWLRPWSSWRGTQELYGALDCLRRGRREEGRARLETIAQKGGALAPLARAELLASDWRWGELARWVETETEPGGSIDPALLARYVRALGELGRLDDLFRTLRQHRALLEAAAMSEVYDLCRLFAFAFSGRVVQVRELLDGPLRGLDAATRQAWLATAEIVAGDAEQGRRRLEQARESADAQLARSIEQRLAQPPAHAGSSPASQQALAELRRDWENERQYAPTAAGARLPWATIGLVAINVAVFGVEVALGGSTDIDTLLRLGALDASHVIEGGQWWRLFAAQVLHFGPLHLVMNVLGLLLLGRFVERRLGIRRYLFVYVAAGTLSILGTVVMTAVGISAPAILVGASGAIMGVVGASGAILMRGWWHERARAARSHLLFVVFILLAQAAIDLLAPGTSFSAHALGAVFGFLVAGPMVRARPLRVGLIGLGGLAATVLAEYWLSHSGWRAAACSPRNVAGCQQSCDGGHAASCAVLADAYLDGVHVARDPARAGELYRQACEGDLALGCNNLGTLYDEGALGPPDLARAAELFRRACSGGSSYGCRNLAFAHLEGRGVPESHQQALALLDRGCAAGDPASCQWAERVRAAHRPARPHRDP
jgi:rhomboid protease GluP